MASSCNITFFDIPSHYADRRSSSPFTWPVRITLNYKKLPYKTVWATTDQIESICKANGIPPSTVLADGTPKYTFPSLIDASDPDNVIRITDSRVIAMYLEKAYPNRPVNPASERAKSIEQYGLSKLAPAIIPPVMRAYVANAPPNVLAYYEKVAPNKWGMTLQEALEAGGDIGSERREGHWKAVKVGLEGLGLKDDAKWLGGGEEPQYEDFILLGWLMLIYLGGEDGWSKLESWEDGKWKRYWEAAQEYITVKLN